MPSTSLLVLQLCDHESRWTNVDILEGALTVLDVICSLEWLTKYWKFTLGTLLLLGGIAGAVIQTLPLLVFVSVVGLALLGWGFFDRQHIVD